MRFARRLKEGTMGLDNVAYKLRGDLATAHETDVDVVGLALKAVGFATIDNSLNHDNL
jgi:hypothetical protein